MLAFRHGRLGVSTGFIAVVGLGCGSAPEFMASNPIPRENVSPTLSAVVLTPDSVVVLAGTQRQFSAQGLFSNGSTAALPVTWNATGGTVTNAGLFTADSIVGTFQVVASSDGRSDTSTVTVAPAPPPGAYQTLVRADWKDFTDKAALTGLFGVEGGLNAQPPSLPVTDFYELVDDPVFGKAVRYNGGPQLNITATDMPGRVAVHKVALGSSSSVQPDPSWWPGPNGRFYPTHLWVRQFIRFSPNWTAGSTRGGQGAADYKAMFLRYYNSPARHEFKVANVREWVMGGGNPGLTLVDQGKLSWSSVQSINDQYGVQGYPGVDLYPMVKVTSLSGICYPAGAPCALEGDGEWYEMVMHHRTVGERGEFSQYLRRYTSGGIVDPGPWRINARYSVALPGEVFIGISHYQMGVNRNRQYDEVMFHDWGPYEVVDGSQFPNPWGLPTN